MPDAVGGRSPRTPLRRSVVALLFVQQLNYLWIPQGIMFAVLGVFAGDARAGAILGAVFALPSASVFLFGVSVTDTDVIYGFVGKRRVIALDDVVDLTIGKTQCFGPRGMDLNGIRVGLEGGTNVMIGESRSCSRKRLLEWAAAIVERAPHIAVREGYITAESYRADPSRYVMDFTRPQGSEDG